jgi:hypothetical protein
MPTGKRCANVIAEMDCLTLDASGNSGARAGSVALQLSDVDLRVILVQVSGAGRAC